MRRLLEEWAPRAHRFALRMTLDHHLAEDLTQETLLRAWRQRSTLRDATGIGAWLFKIMANLWKDHLRRSQSPVARAGTLADEPARERERPDETVARREELRLALAALDALPPRQRQVLYLSSCEGLSASAISDVLGISTGAVKASISVARSTLRRQWLQPGDPEPTTNRASS